MRNGYRKSEDEKTLLAYLERVKATETKPIRFSPPFEIVQVQNGTGYLDFATVPIQALWHKRKTVYVEYVESDYTKRLALIDCYYSSKDGYYYNDYWYNLKDLLAHFNLPSTKYKSK